MKLEINVLYLYIVVSCVVFEIPSGGKHYSEFRPLILAAAALDQHKRYKGPPLTGTIRLF